MNGNNSEYQDMENNNSGIELQNQLIEYAKDIGRLYQDLRRENEKLKNVNRRLEESYKGSLLICFDLIKLYDDYLASHCRRVAYYSEKIACILKLKESEVLAIRLAALLHDIGLMGMSKTDIRMLSSRLQRNKVVTGSIYREHTKAKILPEENVPLFHELQRIIRSHHEYYDGTGFPDGLKEKEIPLGSRIILVADEFDMLKLARSHKSKSESILQGMSNQVGQRFDPEVFEAFSELFEQGDPLSRTIAVNIQDLTPGMVLAKPILTIENTAIMVADSELNSTVISLVQRFIENKRLLSPKATIYRPRDNA